MARKPAPKSPARARPPWLEWVISGLGLLIVLAVLGVLLFEVASGADRPPEIAVRVASIQPSGDGWRVEAEAVNAGDAAAAQVRIVATLDGRDTAEAELDYLPGAGTRSISLWFAADPRGRPLELHATGWIEP